jgi:hypothetical protein
MQDATAGPFARDRAGGARRLGRDRRGQVVPQRVELRDGPRGVGDIEALGQLLPA